MCTERETEKHVSPFVGSAPKKGLRKLPNEPGETHLANHRSGEGNVQFPMLWTCAKLPAILPLSGR